MTEQFVDITAIEPGEGGRGEALRRWFIGPPRWLFGVIVAANVVLTLVALSAPGGFFAVGLVAIAGWLGLGLTFVARLGLALTLGGGPRGVRRSGRRWLAVPVVVLLTGALVVADVPMRVGLELAKPEMVRFAEDPDARFPQTLGLYRVTAVERLPGGGARFLLSGTGVLDSGGYAYSPSGPPPRLGEDRYEHVSGPWYAWTDSW